MEPTGCERVFSPSRGVCASKRDGLSWAEVERLVRVPYNNATRRLDISSRVAYEQYVSHREQKQA
jgi:hypothetical protein